MFPTLISSSILLCQDEGWFHSQLLVLAALGRSRGGSRTEVAQWGGDTILLSSVTPGEWKNEEWGPESSLGEPPALWSSRISLCSDTRKEPQNRQSLPFVKNVESSESHLLLMMFFWTKESKQKKTHLFLIKRFLIGTEFRKQTLV